jgi:tetratricopeptide (TPR) repeat protein
MNAEMLRRLDDLRSGIKSLYYKEAMGMCVNLGSGFCMPNFLIIDGFAYSFSSLNVYKTQFQDPLILENLQTFEVCLQDLLQLNREAVKIDAWYLGIQVPVDKRTVTYMERRQRHRDESHNREESLYEGEDRNKMWEIMTKARDHQKVLMGIVDTITQRADELIDGRTIPPRYYNSNDTETFDESDLPPFIQKIVYPYNSKPQFEYVDPPEPEPEHNYSDDEWGDQRAKDLTRRASHEYTDQAIRTLRGALRFGRTGLYAHRAFSMLGELYERQGLYEKALEHYSLAITSIKQPFAYDYADRGKMYFRLGYWAEAKADFKEALRWRLERKTYDEIQNYLIQIDNHL